MKKILKTLLIILGTFFLILGLIGLLLPVVPTTPFLIIAGLCYINSSKKLYLKVINIKYFGPHVKNYVEKREITRAFKLSSLLFIWIPTSFTAIFILNSWTIRAFTLSFALIVTIYVLKLKTMN